jgi:hypothetical protein
MEFIRFPSKESSRKAMRVFLTGPDDVYMTFREEWPEGTCLTNTSTVRALQALGVDFEWLTKDLDFGKL